MSLPKCMDFTDYNRYPGEENPTTDAQMQDFMLNQNLLVKAAAAKMWQPSTEYATGDIVTSPSMPAGTEAVCMGAGMSDSALEPSWAVGTIVPDGSCFWQVRYVHYADYLATNDEAIAGEDEKKIVTPSAMKAAIDAILAELNVGVKTVNGNSPDAGGNVNIKDYVSNITISGKTITVTFKDGTTKTLTTQDTAPYTASATAIGGASATKPAVVVSSYRSGTSWWRKYSDGWVEQGGLVSGSGYNSVTISLHVVMKTTEYCAMSVAVGGGKVSSGFGDASNLTTSTFSSHQHGSHRWYVCGY